MMERFERTDGAPVDHQNDISLAVLNVICAMVFNLAEGTTLKTPSSTILSSSTSIHGVYFLQGFSSVQEEIPGAQRDILRRQYKGPKRCSV